MSIKRFAVLGILMCYMISACSGLAVYSRNVDRITKEYLKANLDSPDFVIIDVRIDSSWKSSEFKIKGAVREDSFDVASWADKYSRENTIVLYCS